METAKGADRCERSTPLSRYFVNPAWSVIRNPSHERLSDIQACCGMM